MALLADRLRSAFADCGATPTVVVDVFGAAGPADLAATLEDVCRRTTGRSPAGVDFVEASVGLVAGLVLDDDRRVTLKVHGPRVTVDYLAAVRTVQIEVRARGLPAPLPLAGPVPVGRGLVTVEETLDVGGHPDARARRARRTLAVGLASFVAATRDLVALPGLADHFMHPRDELWPAPHDGRFDFAATAPGAEWIDRIGTVARERLSDAVGPLVVGHVDWRAQNVRTDGDRMSAIYDWDSVAVLPEPVLVGQTAFIFAANWQVETATQYPSAEEAAGFVRDYEDARGSRFTDAERQTADAALVYVCGYTARCEHADATDDVSVSADGQDGRPPAGSARAFLAAHGRRLIGSDPSSS